MEKNNELYKVTILEGKVANISWLEDAKVADIEEVDSNLLNQSLPKYSRTSNNNGYSYCDPTSENNDILRGNIEKLGLPDGTYYLTMQYQHFRGGWAMGSNWYGGSICSEAPSRIDVIEGRIEAKDCIDVTETNVSEISFPDKEATVMACRAGHMGDYNMDGNWLVKNDRTEELEVTRYRRHLQHSQTCPSCNYSIRPVLEFDKNIDPYFCGEKITLFGHDWELIQQDGKVVGLCTEGVVSATPENATRTLQQWYEEISKEYQKESESLDDMLKTFDTNEDRSDVTVLDERKSLDDTDIEL